MTRVLVIDHVDSFTYNLVHAVHAAGATPIVHRHDRIDAAAVRALDPDGILLSPGPGHPAVPRDFQVSADLVREPLDVPMLGVCLGMQGMAHHTGGRVLPAPGIVHGEASPVRRPDHPWFKGLPDVFQAGRYHSLVVDADALPASWLPLGGTEDGLLMAMAHRTRPWLGVQFHPESILTPDGPTIVANFVEACA